MRRRSWAIHDWLVLIAGALALVCLLLALGGCGASKPARGSAAESSAAAGARASTTAAAADEARVDARTSAAEADELERQARASGAQDAIDRAVAARLVAEKAKARAEALNENAKKAQIAAERASAAAAIEREREQIAADARRWLRLCQWIGLGLAVAGVVLGVILARVASLRIGASAAGLLVGLGGMVVGWGATQPWLLGVGGVGVLLVLGAWAWLHDRTLSESERRAEAAEAVAHLADAFEAGSGAYQVDAAKVRTKAALVRAGLQERVQKARGKA